MKKSKSIFIGNFPLAPWKKTNEDVFIDSRGRIYSQSMPPIKDATRGKNFKRMHGFCEEYFNKKRLKYDVKNFCKMDIKDVVEMLEAKNRSSISANQLTEIYHWRNQIAEIKQLVKNRFRKSVLKMYNKELYLTKGKLIKTISNSVLRSH